MLPEKILKINPLKKVVLGPETWDREKFLVFMRTFDVSQGDVAKAIGLQRDYISRLACGKIPFDQYHERLTAYKNAIKKSKIEAVKAYAKEMIKYYRSFE